MSQTLDVPPTYNAGPSSASSEVPPSTGPLNPSFVPRRNAGGRDERACASVIASFALGIQERANAREIAMMKETHRKNAEASKADLESLQQELGNNQAMAAASTAEFNIQLQVLTAKVDDASRKLSETLNDLIRERDASKQTVTNLPEKIASAEREFRTGIEAVKSCLSLHEMDVRRQMSELEAKISDLSEAKRQIENELALLKRKVKQHHQQRPEFSAEAAELVRFLMSRQADLIQLLDQCDDSRAEGVGVGHSASSIETDLSLHENTASELYKNKRTIHVRPSPASQTSSDGEEELPNYQSWERSPELDERGDEQDDDREQSASSVFHAFHDHFKAMCKEYGKKPPNNDVKFVWTFIEGIEDDGLKEFTQTMLLKKFPDLVSVRRGKNNDKPGRIITFKNLTWEQARASVESELCPRGFLR